jgi:type II secretory pathway component PulC
MLGALLVLVATIGWHLHTTLRNQSGANTSTRPASAPRSPPANRADLTVLEQWHPFGVPVQDTAPSRPIEATPLNIALRGVIAGPGEESGSAIIADANGVETAYGVGDTVADGAILTAVERRRVLIKRGDQLESIALPSEPSTGGEALPLPETPAPLPQPANPAPPPSASAAPMPPPAPNAQPAPQPANPDTPSSSNR